MSFPNVDQTGSGVEQSHPLLVFPLLRHLVPQVRQLGRELLHQFLRLIQLEIFGDKTRLRIEISRTTHLTLQCFPLILFPVHVLNCQRDRSQSRKPVQTPVLAGNERNK